MRGARPDAALEASVARAANMQAGECVVAAASGGSDSGALAALLARAAAAAGATVVLGHVNHALRASAWQDEAVVLALGATLRLRVVTESLSAGVRAEARLRSERYEALVRMARVVGARRIVTAHHARDQTETVLLALFRGASPAGLAGMAPVRELVPGIELTRPLLGIEPAQLRAYLTRRQLPFALDPSNADPAFRRNAIRLALESLRESFPQLDRAVARCAALARQERDAAPRATLRAWLKRELGGIDATRDVTFERFDAVARAIEGRAPGRHHLRPGLEVVIGTRTSKSGEAQP